MLSVRTAILCFVALVASATTQQQGRSTRYEISSNVAKLTRDHTISTRSSKALHDRLVGQTSIGSEYAGLGFYTDVIFGDQNFSVIIDTGSSDTWLVETGFTCVNFTNNATIPAEDCYFASTFTPDSDFTQIQDENFNISYADLEYLNGIVGYDKLTIANITVSKQEIGLANLAGWQGDNITSGLTGLAYPLITSAFAGTNATADNFNSSTSHLPYSPIINTIFFVENLTNPLFSLSLSRNPAMSGFGGYLTIGGIPDPSMPTINATGDFTTVPINQLTDQFTPTPQYVFYGTTVDYLVLDGIPIGGGSSQYIVDSGTTLNYLPTEQAAAINALFDPPAQEQDGMYFVACNATAPSLGVTIGGTTFDHNPLDLVSNSSELGGNLCVSGVQDGGEGEDADLILGDVFMKNVLIVFDVGNETLGFSPRPYYDLE